MRHLLPCGILATLVALAGCGGGTRHSAVTAAADSAAALAPIDAARVLALAADGRARVTVVNVWATWCAPCREEFPALLEAAAAHRADGVRLLLVSTDFEDQAGDVRRFLAERGVRDTTYLKHQGDLPFIDTLNPGWSGTIPATFVYDSTGRRVAFWEGRADRARFEAAIRKALGRSPATHEETPS
jgi:thiol-disulfide isomerase/thioredoxin